MPAVGPRFVVEKPVARRRVDSGLVRAFVMRVAGEVQRLVTLFFVDMKTVVREADRLG